MKGIPFDADVVERCKQAMREGVPLQQISVVEGVHVQTLYQWRYKEMSASARRPEPSTLISEMRSLRDELNALRQEVQLLRLETT